MQRPLPRLFFSLTAALVFSAASSEAGAVAWTIKDTSSHDRPMRLDIVAHFEPYPIGFGPSVWFSYPIVPDGFLPMLNDAFSIEGGGGFTAHWGTVGVCDWTWMRTKVLAGVRWDFQLTDNWTIYAKGKVGGRFDFGESTRCSAGGITFQSHGGNYDGFGYDFGPGAYFHLNDRFELRLDLSYTDSGFDPGAGISIKF